MTIAVGIAVSFGYGKHIEEISDPTAPLRVSFTHIKCATVTNYTYEVVLWRPSLL